MKLSYRTRFLAFAILMPLAFFVGQALAQSNDFVIAGGGGAKEGSIYSAVIGDLAGVCSTDTLTLKEQTTNGGAENLDLLLKNKVNAALVPSGLLFNMRDENAASVANIKTLFAMHPEAIHLIARSDTKEEGGYGIGKFKVGTDKITYNNAEDLKGRAVGAVGGSVVDANTISSKMRFGWNVTPFPKTSDMLAALVSGQIDAVVIQAGAGSPAVSGLKGQYKLIPLRGNSDTDKIWSNTKVQYSNLNQGKAVDTLQAPALLVTRKWSSKEMNERLATLVQCFKSNLDKIKDTTGTNAVWQSISLDNQGQWPMYELPNLAGAPVATKKK